MEEISIIEIVKMMWKRWWLFLIVCFIAAVAAFGFTKLFLQPVYVSTGTMYVTNASSASNTQNNVNLSDVMLAQELTATYSKILSSNTFMKKVSNECGLGYSYQEIKNVVAYSQEEGVPVLVVHAASYNPKDACIIAETVLNCAQEEISRVIKGGVVEVIDRAEIPLVPSSPNVSKNVLMAVLAAAVILAILIFCIEYFDDRVHSADELSEYELSVLAEIPYVLNDEEKQKQQAKQKPKNKKIA